MKFLLLLFVFGGASAQTITSFGDSVTFASNGPTTRDLGYVSWLCNYEHAANVQKAVNATCASDQAAAIYGTTVTASSVSTYMIGVNDERTYGTSSNLLHDFTEIHYAELSWLATPLSNKSPLRDSVKVTFTGSWTDTPAYGIGRYTCDPSATCTTTVSGSVVTVGFIAINVTHNQHGQFMVLIDGHSYGPITCCTLGDISTPMGGGGFAPFAISFPGLSSAAHSVTISVSHANNDDLVFVDWIGGNGGLSTNTGPAVYAAGPIKTMASWYPVYGGSDENVATYNAVISGNVDLLRSYGFNANFVDVGGYDPATDTCADGLHPNDAGHKKLAAYFESAMGTTLVQPTPR